MIANAEASSALTQELEITGIARLPALVSAETLRDMQRAFAARLGRLRWNDNDGYERTERHRFMVQDVLTLAQGFVDIALHPLVKEVLSTYLGGPFVLCEAKGWKSLPTTKDFHGWHGDSWYDQEKVKDRIPREVKLGFYLTDVQSGAFQFIKGSHRQVVPRHYKKHEVPNLPIEKTIEMTGPAGSAFLFDTSGVHRQAIPILEPRQAVFLNYHDPDVPLQKEDIDYYRYHPLLLNAAFLGNLADDDYRILGFGNKTNYLPAFERQSAHGGFQRLMGVAYATKLYTGEFGRRVASKLKRMLGRS